MDSGIFMQLDLKTLTCIKVQNYFQGNNGYFSVNILRLYSYKIIWCYMVICCYEIYTVSL